MANIRAILGKQVQLARKAKNISQEELADLTGLHRTYISGIERGRRNPSLEVLERLAMGLDVKVHELLVEGPGPK